MPGRSGIGFTVDQQLGKKASIAGSTPRLLLLSAGKRTRNSDRVPGCSAVAPRGALVYLAARNIRRIGTAAANVEP